MRDEVGGFIRLKVRHVVFQQISIQFMYEIYLSVKLFLPVIEGPRVAPDRLGDVGECSAT